MPTENMRIDPDSETTMLADPKIVDALAVAEEDDPDTRPRRRRPRREED